MASPTLITMPAEISLRIYKHLSDMLYEDHETHVRLRHPRTGHVLNECLRLGFVAPVPRALLEVNRAIREEASDFGFSQSPLRVQARAPTPTSNEVYASDISRANIVSPDWVSLGGRLADPALSQVQHIIRHPLIDCLRELHVNHLIRIWNDHVFSQSEYVIEKRLKLFADFVKSLPGLRRLVLLLRVEKCDIVNRYRLGHADDVLHRDISQRQVISVASTLNAGSKLQLEYQPEMPVSQEEIFVSLLQHLTSASIDHGKWRLSVEANLVSYLAPIRKNGLDVRLFVEGKEDDLLAA